METHQRKTSAVDPPGPAAIGWFALWTMTVLNVLAVRGGNGALEAAQIEFFEAVERAREGKSEHRPFKWHSARPAHQRFKAMGFSVGAKIHDRLEHDTQVLAREEGTEP